MRVFRKYLLVFSLLSSLLFLYYTGLIIISLLLACLLSAIILITQKNILANRIIEALAKGIILVVFFYLFTFFLRTFFIDFYRVPSYSMESTFTVGDYIIVDKFSNGTSIEIPRGSTFYTILFYSFYNVEDSKGFLRLPGFSKYQLNDICLINEATLNKKIVKRIVGLPGDEIRFKQDTVFRNDSLLNFSRTITFNYVDLSAVKHKRRATVQKLSIEEYSNLSINERLKIKRWGTSKKTTLQNFNLPLDWSIHNFGPVSIPVRNEELQIPKSLLKWYGNVPFTSKEIENDHYSLVFGKSAFFLSGDYRHNSIDSRQLGPVRTDLIIGKIIGHIRPFWSTISSQKQ